MSSRFLFKQQSVPVSNPHLFFRMRSLWGRKDCPSPRRVSEMGGAKWRQLKRNWILGVQHCFITLQKYSCRSLSRASAMVVYRGQLRVVFGNLQKSLKILGNFGRVRVIAGGVSKCWVIFVPSFVHTNRLQWNGTQSIRFPLVRTYLITGLIPFYPSIGTIGTNGMLFHW